jgi:ABC-type antimicrobial peptide transport system permease subunit
MRFLDYFRFAFKNLSRQKARTILTIIAITVGSLSLILMASIIISIKESLNDQFKNLGAFDLVTVIKDPNSTNNSSLITGANGDPSEGKMIDDTTLTSLRRLPHVIKATPTVSGFNIKTMRLDGQERKTWASMIAYDPNNDVFNLPMAHGRSLLSTDMDKIVIGNRFIEEMNYKGNRADLIGKKVMLAYNMGGNNSPDWGELPAKPPLNADKDWYESQSKNNLEVWAEIVGVTDYISLGWARRLMTSVSWQYPDCKDQDCGPNLTMQLVRDDQFVRQGYSSIILKTDSEKNIDSVAQEVKKLGYGANTAAKMLEEINKIILMISLVLAVIGGISLFVATIGIINTMIMATYERIKEIGVLRACGATRATIRRLFTAEAAALGFLGGFFGLLISLLLTQVGKYIVTKQASNLGSLPIDKIGNFPWWLIIAILVFTTLLGMISGLIPAIRAARMDPVEALRYE